MTTIATNRVFAEFYQGIDLPADWAERPTHSINVGFARNRVFAIAALLDASNPPLAACWQATGEDEQFVRIRFDAAVAYRRQRESTGRFSCAAQKSTGSPGRHGP